MALRLEDTLPSQTASPLNRRPVNNDYVNKLRPEDRAFHDWYRFVLSFPPHLVREYLERFGVGRSQVVLDPFCGTGTTVVECAKLGVSSVGLEANPMPHFAGVVKTDWRPDPGGLLAHSRDVAAKAAARLAGDGVEDEPALYIQPDGRLQLRTLSPERLSLLLTHSISPLPLHKTLVLLDCLEEFKDARFHRHELLALAKALVTSIGNLAFGPEVGVGLIKPDAPVIAPWLAGVRTMAADLADARSRGLIGASAVVHHADSRQIGTVLESGLVDAVITSPPYPNEKDYTRTTRLESVLLGFIPDNQGLRSLKRGLLRSNTRGVYKGDDDDLWAAHIPEVDRLAEEIEARRVALGKTSGFERMYARVTRLYFGGMARHLAELRRVLRPGARLAYVVGDQASYLRVMIRTGQVLANIGQSLGYELAGIDLHRTRLATATREQLREEVVLFRWPG